MRRKDREMGREFALKVIDEAAYMVLSLRDGDGVYSIPLSPVRIENSIYFHCAYQGKKIELLQDGVYGRMVFVSDATVPSLMTKEEVSKGLEKGKMDTGKIFTTEFASAIASGPLTQVSDKEEKILFLRKLCEKYVPSMMEFFQNAIDDSLRVTAAYKLEIQELTAKRKKFDSSGKEMKFQRME